MIFEKEEGAICLTDYENTLVFPLTVEELELLQNDKNYFENYINLKYCGDEFLQNSPLEKQFELFKQSKSDLPWLAIWAIVSAKEQSIVGTINFKNIPDKNNQVQIDFFVSPQFRCRGFASTAVDLLSQWAFENHASKIIAKTQKSNLASKKVLTNNDFELAKTSEDLLIFEKHSNI